MSVEHCWSSLSGVIVRKLTAAEEKQSGGKKKAMDSSQNAHDAHHPSYEEDDHTEGQQHDEHRLHV